MKVDKLQEELHRLQELHSEGTLSNEEFTQAKAIVLEQFSIADVTNSTEQIILASTEKRDVDQNQWTMFLHLSLLTGYIVPFSGVIISILIWQLKKKEIPLLDVHGKNMINWEISKFIYGIVSIWLSAIFIGFLLLAALAGCNLVFVIIAALKARNGKVWQYPLAIPFLK